LTEVFKNKKILFVLAHLDDETFGFGGSLQRLAKNNDILLFIDEGDATFHPEWKIKYVNSILKIFPEICKEKTIQIIFTTHDPLTLSDILDSNIIYLKNKKVLNETEKQRFNSFKHFMLGSNGFNPIDGFI
jgi:predicted ATP-binding protein involved in virulence